MKKIAILMALALASFSLAANRVGPVSQYGQLQAKAINGKGRIAGSCATYKNTPVQVRGMSLYWSIHPDATEFYNETSIGKMVTDMNIEMIRIPVGTDEGSWGSGAPGGYINDPNDQKALIDAVVQAAIKYDIYVIIDWHSHKANLQLDAAKNFFRYMAQTYGSYNNVIFEIFNEPVCADGNPNTNAQMDACSGKGGYLGWSGIKSYAEQVIDVIRVYSDNLVLVGTPKWDQEPNQVMGNAIDDENVAYTFHYYANTHTTGYEGGNAETAINNGLPVFISEWGTANADGGGSPDEGANSSWQTWVNTYKLSSANWSASRINEGTAAFTTASDYSNFYYTSSGNIVKAIFMGNPDTYTKCSTTPNSSSSGNSSASTEDAALIDDFEDENTTAEALGEAFWYLYEAGGTVSNKTILNDDGDEIWDIIRSSGSNHYAAMEGIDGIEFGDETYPSVGMGMDIPDAVLENCTAIQYDYKGTGHKFRALVDGVTADKGYEHVSGNQNKATTWKTVTITVDDMNQPSWVAEQFPKQIKDFSWAGVKKIAWVVDEKIPNAQLGEELQIDNLKCVGTLPEIESSSSSGAENSSSSVKPSSSSVKPSSSSAAPALVLIDDLKDGNTGVEFFGDDGYWFIYEANGGSVSNTQEGEVWDMVRGNATNYYAAMLGISGITEDDDTYPSVGMAMHVMETGLEECSAIQYDYRGSGHIFRAAISSVTKDKGYNHVTTAKSKSTGWTTVTVKTANLKQPSWIPATEKKDFSWAEVYELAWVVDEKISDDERGTTLEVDNVYCVPQTEESSSSSVISSSADAECEDGDELHRGTAYLKCVDGMWVDMNSSSSTGSSSSASTPGFALIDDFQDENTQSESLGEAYWYIYKAGGSVTNKQDTKTQSWDMVRIDGENAYVAMEGISGITYGATTYPSVGMGLDVPASSFNNCTAITYEYRGSAHMFRAGLSTVTADKGYEHITGIQPKATTWTPVTVTAADLKQPTWIPATEKKTFSWAQVVKMAWVVDEKIKDADRGTNLDIDNVTCIGSLPAPKSSSSVKPGSSSSAGARPGSSSATNGNGNGSNNNGTGNNGAGDDGYGMAIGEIASPSGLKASIMGNTLVVSVARAGLVKVQVFDMMGHAIERHSENMAAGSFAHDFAKLNKGAYIVRVQQGSMVKTVRMQVR